MVNHQKINCDLILLDALASFFFKSSYFGSSSYSTSRIYSRALDISKGKSLHKTQIEVVILEIKIFSIFYLLSQPFIPCQGKYPFIRYIKIQIIASMSSLLDCSIPSIVFMDEYRAVPLKPSLLSLQSQCFLSILMYFLPSDSPVKYSLLGLFYLPYKKCYGLKSRWINPFEWTIYILQIICTPNSNASFRSSFPPLFIMQRSREGPRKITIIQLKVPSEPISIIWGIPKSVILSSP